MDGHVNMVHQGYHVYNAIFSIPIAILLGWFAFHGLSMRVRTVDWTLTNGTVVSQTDYSLLRFVTNCDVEYKYEVRGKVYYSKRTDNWESGTNPGLCNYLSEHTGVNEIKVFYDANMPAESLLDNTLDPFYFTVLSVLSLYQAVDGLVSMVKMKMMPGGIMSLAIGMYSIIIILSTIWVGVTNFNDYFASSFFATFFGLSMLANLFYATSNVMLRTTGDVQTPRILPTSNNMIRTPLY